MKFPNSSSKKSNINGNVILSAAKDLTASPASIEPTSAIARSCKTALIFLTAVLVLTHSVHAAATPSFQQQPSPEPQQAAPPPQPHKIKIWTNEDIVTLRTPADLYILEKEAKAAADDAKALMSCFAPGPENAELEDTQKEIDAATQSIRDAEAAVVQAKKDLDAAPENLKSRNRTELDRRTLELDAYRDQLKLLQHRLQKLNAQPSAPEPSAAPLPSGPQPSATPSPSSAQPPPAEDPTVPATEPRD